MGFMSDVGDAFSDATSWSSLIGDAMNGFHNPGKSLFSLPSNLFGPGGANSDTDGISSTIQGPNPPPPATPATSDTFGSQAGKLLSAGVSGVAKGFGSMSRDVLDSASKEGVSAVMNNIFHKNDASKQGSATRKYLQSAFPQLNPWERAGAGGSMAGVQDAGFAQTTKQTQMNNDTQVKLANIQSDTTKYVAGVNAATSRMNTADQVFAQNSLLESNKAKLKADTQKTLNDASLSTQQKSESIARTYTQYLQAHGVQLTNEQIPVITDHIRSQIENTNADTVNKKGPQTTFGKNVNDVIYSRYLRDTGSPNTTDKIDTSNLPIGDPMAIFAPVIHRNASNFHNAAGVRGSMSRK